MPTLVLSVSGARGIVGDGLDAGIVYRLARAYAGLLAGGTVLLGRDSRPSGPDLARATAAGLIDGGCGVVDLGIVATPTVQVAVEHGEARGGIIVTASHNPVEWNALKFVGADGTFLGPEPMGRLLQAFDASGGPRGGAGLTPGEQRRIADLPFGLAERTPEGAAAVDLHVRLILEAVETAPIRARKLTVAVDAVHGAGAVLLEPLLEALGVRAVWIDREPDGHLPPHPEPRPERLGPLHDLVRASGAALGLALDPDGDRCAVVTPEQVLGEEWSLPLAALVRLTEGGRGPLVTNLSTSGRLEQVAERFGVRVLRAPVGEAHVVGRMRAEGALLGGEGNGGVIDPRVHYGRDAGVACALLLALEAGDGVARAAARFAPLEMVKRKLDLAPERRPAYMEALRRDLGLPQTEVDGLRWSFGPAWLHVRPSGTEPVVRAIAEAPTLAEAEALVARAEARAAEFGPDSRGRTGKGSSQGRNEMRTAIQTDAAPAAIGPYSQGNRAGSLVFTAGQLGLDPQTGQLVAGGIEPECRRALENLKAVLEAGGSGLDRVVKVTVFLQSMAEFAQMNEIYKSYFGAPYPARSAIEVAALPKGGRVEIEAIALAE